MESGSTILQRASVCLSRRWRHCWVLLSLTWLPIPYASAESAAAIRPILADKCYPCHGPDEHSRQADLRLDDWQSATRDRGGYAAIVPHDVTGSALVRRIDSNDDDERMPPLASKLTLTQSEKETLRHWVAAGAPWEDHWSLVAPIRPQLPDSSSTLHPIDAFVEDRLQTVGLRLSAEAAPEKLIRRVTLDLTGLPPTLGEVDRFVRAYAEQGEAAYQALVERLLASPRYGETMTLAWLDAARYADTDGYQYDGPRHQWRWRDWVIDAYNANMPFDQFTIEQLAGDLLPESTLEQSIATGFNRNHRYNSELGLVVDEFLLENAVDRVDTTATVWMGLTVGCARCHDHKFDPISQQDYYQLVAFFNSVPEAGRAIKAGNSEPLRLAPTKDQQSELKRRELEVAAALASVAPVVGRPVSDLLIDRQLVHRIEFEALSSAAAAAEVAAPDTPRPTLTQRTVEGSPRLQGRTVVLDGQSTVALRQLEESLTFAANQRFTISFWLRPDLAAESIILSRQNRETTRPGIELALLDDGRLQFDLITTWVGGAGRTTTKLPLTIGRWYHVAVTNDGSMSANGQAIYLDGERVGTIVTLNTNSSPGGVRADRPLVIGGGIRPGAKQLRGALRDLRLYRTALWPEEIAVLGAEPGSQPRRQFARLRQTPAYTRYVDLKEALEEFRDTLPTVMVMRETAEPKPTYVRKRGVYHDYGQRVQRDVPSCLPPMAEKLPRNRLGLAKWLMSPGHPLTARVAVNRYWQKYFGVGLVKTPEDFGAQGEPPSHPRLLDWLATEFTRSGWDVAKMQELIVTSRTYRQRSVVTTAMLKADPTNRLLARSPRLRLSGHAIRDQALFTSGLLVEQIGGPSVSPYQPADLWAEVSMGMKYRQSEGEDLYRRSLYTVWKRTVAPPMLALFDAASREACWVGRRETNTPLQALTLLNETGLVECARQLAARMLREGGSDAVGYGFRLLTARLPHDAERRLLNTALCEYREEFSRQPRAANQLLTIGESADFHDIAPQQLAAYTALANVMLNLDEVITRE